jgi:metallophosphoesterase (TIGR00282 family)
VNILFVGDVFGRPGRDALIQRLPSLLLERGLDFVIANGENAASGAGITSKIATALLNGGVDVITTGNHIWRQREVFPFLQSERRIVRPANYPAGSPGRSLTVQETRSGESVAVVNLSGALFMDTGISPFRVVDSLVEQARARAETVVVDFHAEATSEKVALGTHTHVQTSDARVLPGGTAYVTDVGMTGPKESVIGVSTEVILRRFLTEMPQQFVVAGGPVRMDYAVVVADHGRALSVETCSETFETNAAEKEAQGRD